MSKVTVSTGMSELQDFIRKLNLVDDNVNRAIRSVMHEGGEIIAQEQRRLISGVSHRLSDAISVSNVYTTKKGAIAITSGYQPSAFQKDASGMNAGEAGMTWEFGRPGKSPKHSSPTMQQKRRGKVYTVKKGVIQPVPHIRRGFDNKKSAAADLIIQRGKEEIEKIFRG